ncbi:hypothetical protein A1O7_09719 [Cladophialophora yegresii CBS 114405]|uniref:Uncharacterized protein n=1 Tax=Cladophialophora yegresii CBS 114405 TaxID=1182544 RepID=W9VN16_9EURO|nr:uncharacterized protein A1O7_09719 [Cladophialophora yegresii CBS 114405]EXJ54380.1 hypothetical protein A1O7_09719 [Cladophialophora yegresii CBS 114405]
MSVLFKSFWCVVFASAKMMEPFYQLAKQSARATAEASVLRPYLQGGIDWADMNPANKHWVMFVTTFISIVLGLQASVASEAMTIQAGSTCNTQNGTQLCDPVWVINSAVVRGLQASLIITALAMVTLAYLNWNRPSGVTSYPCSIACMASVLSNSNDEMTRTLREIDPDAKEEAVKEAFKGKLLTFERTETLSGENVVGITMGSGSSEETNHDMPGSDIQPTTSSDRDLTDVAEIAEPPSLMSRVPWKQLQVALIVFLHLAMFGVILSFVLAGNDVYQVNLLGADGEKHNTAVKWKFLDGTKFGPRFFMTSITSFLLIPFWENVELSVRIMAPYRRLKKSTSESRHLFTMYLHGVPFTALFKALWHGNWYHAFVTLITVLSYFLLIFIAGVPYNYGQMEDLSFISSAASLVILCLMLVGLVTLAFWHHSNPKMPRRPDTLVNTWLLMCSSRFIEGFKGRTLTEMQDEIDHGTTRYWFKKAEGVDGIERWMVEAEGDQAQRRLLLGEKAQRDNYY